MDFHYFPYGNARQTKKPDGTYSFSCQHGANECAANLVMACAMNFHANYTDYMPFVACMEDSSAPVNAGSKCAQSAGWDYSEIESCTTSALGNKLMHAIADATEGLSPAHQWTPWVVMNGKPLSQSQLDQHLVKLVCDAYTGSNKPPACNKHTVCTNEVSEN